MGCTNCGRAKRRSVMAGDDRVKCPNCGKMAKKNSIYYSWCACGAHIDIDGRTGEIRHCYGPEVFAVSKKEQEEAKKSAGKGKQ